MNYDIKLVNNDFDHLHNLFFEVKKF